MHRGPIVAVLPVVPEHLLSPRRGEQKVDVVEILHFGFIHPLIVPQVHPTG